MKALIIVLAFIPGLLQAQVTKDSLDNLQLKITPDWNISRQATYLELTSSKYGNFCQMVVYKQQPAASDKYASFRKEWNETVLFFFDATTLPAPLPKKIKNGSTVLSFGTEAVNKANKLPYYVELNTFDFGTSVQSVMLTSGNKKYLRLYDSLWQSVLNSNLSAKIKF